MKCIDLIKKRREPLSKNDIVIDFGAPDLYLPDDYVSFVAKYRMDFMEQFTYNLPYWKGFFKNNNFVDVLLFIDLSMLWRYKIVYSEDEFFELDICQIADNNIPSGGIYMGIGDENRGVIYSYLNEPDRANQSEIIQLSNSFLEFVNELKFYSFSDVKKEGYSLSALWEVEVALGSNHNPFLYPWEE